MSTEKTKPIKKSQRRADWNAGRRLDQIDGFGGKLIFLIPYEWVQNEEEKDGDFYLYVDPKFPAMWFRASLISIENVANPGERLKGMFSEYEIEPETHNFVSRSEKDTRDGRTALHQFYWMVANVVPPSSVREAVFSYTVLKKGVKTRAVQREIDLINTLVRQARFA